MANGTSSCSIAAALMCILQPVMKTPSALRSHPLVGVSVDWVARTYGRYYKAEGLPGFETVAAKALSV